MLGTLRCYLAVTPISSILATDTFLPPLLPRDEEYQNVASENDIGIRRGGQRLGEYL